MAYGSGEQGGTHDTIKVNQFCMLYNGPFSVDVTHTPRIIPGGQRAVKCIAFYGKNPTSASISACKLRLGIATHERTALFVEQRERFHLPFVATSCDLPSWRYSLLEITLSFRNAQSVPILVCRPCIRDFDGHGWIRGLRAMNHDRVVSV